MCNLEDAALCCKRYKSALSPRLCLLDLVAAFETPQLSLITNVMKCIQQLLQLFSSDHRGHFTQLFARCAEVTKQAGSELCSQALFFSFSGLVCHIVRASQIFFFFLFYWMWSVMSYDHVVSRILKAGVYLNQIILHRAYCTVARPPPSPLLSPGLNLPPALTTL